MASPQLQFDIPKHRVILGCVLCAQLLVPVFAAGYYELFRKPALIARGATSCDDYNPQMREWMPPDCDIAIRLQDGDTLEERYTAKYGVKSTVVRTRSGRWVSTSTSYSLTKLLLIFPAAGIFLAAVATVHKTLRVRTIWQWELQRHPADQFERLLWYYSLPIFLLGVGLVGLAQLAA